jgi:hypothetical protein
VRGALPSPRVGRKSRRATDGPRWMAIPDAPRRGGTELGLQTALADVFPGSCVKRAACSAIFRYGTRVPPVNTLSPLQWVSLNNLERPARRTNGPASRYATAMARAGAQSFRRPSWNTVRTVDINRVTATELLDAWRDALRAAELAERLASSALRAADRGDRDAATAEELAVLAEDAATAAERAARAAREAATKAATDAKGLRADLTAADQAAADAQSAAGDAPGRYQDAVGPGAADEG